MHFLAKPRHKMNGFVIQDSSLFQHCSKAKAREENDFPNFTSKQSSSELLYFSLAETEMVVRFKGT